MELSCPIGVISTLEVHFGTPAGQCGCPVHQRTQAGGGCPDATVSFERQLAKRDTAVPLATFLSGATLKTCYRGADPVLSTPCCSARQVAGVPDFSNIALLADPACDSPVAQRIVERACLGERKCSLSLEADTPWPMWEDYPKNTTEVWASLGEGLNATLPACTPAARRMLVTATCQQPTIELTWYMKLLVPAALRVPGETGELDSIKAENVWLAVVMCDMVAVLVFVLVSLWLAGKQRARARPLSPPLDADGRRLHCDNHQAPQGGGCRGRGRRRRGRGRPRGGQAGHGPPEARHGEAQGRPQGAAGARPERRPRQSLMKEIYNRPQVGQEGLLFLELQSVLAGQPLASSCATSSSCSGRKCTCSYHDISVRN